MANEMNVTLMGRLGSDPILRLSEGKKPFVRVNLATSPRIRKDDEWVDGHTSWYELKAWGDLARNLAASLSKGNAVVVHGELRIEQYTNDQGASFKNAVVLVDSIGANLKFAQTQTIRVRHEEPERKENDSPFSISAETPSSSVPGAEPGNESNAWPQEVDAETALTA